MQNERYNGWANYATWRINLECFDGWEDELTPESAEELVEELIFEQTSEGIARDYALAFIAQVDWTEIALAHCPSYSEKWREEFSEAFCKYAPEGFDSEADSECSSPWQAPWEWEDYENWALDEDPQIAARKFLESILSDLERELASEETQGGDL